MRLGSAPWTMPQWFASSLCAVTYFSAKPLGMKAPCIIAVGYDVVDALLFLDIIDEDARGCSLSLANWHMIIVMRNFKVRSIIFMSY